MRISRLSVDYLQEKSYVWKELIFMPILKF